MRQGLLSETKTLSFRREDNIVIALELGGRPIKRLEYWAQLVFLRLAHVGGQLDIWRWGLSHIAH
jgi:hypothetical protein